MDSRLAVVLSVVAVLLSQANGLPREPSPPEVSSAETLEEMSPLEEMKRFPPLGEMKKTSTAEKKATEKLKNSPEATKLKVNFPEDSKPTDEEKDIVRSKKSPSYREITAYGPSYRQIGQVPRSTKVCIEVFSEHHPQVICGPPAEEAKKEENSVPASRYASAYAYDIPRAAYAPPPPMRYARPPSRASAYPTKRTEDIPLPVSPMPAAPASGQQQLAPYPVRTIPIIQQRYVMPVMSQGLVSPAQSLLRLNCGIQSDGGSLYNSPLLRSSSPLVAGYYPIGEPVIKSARYSFAAPRAAMAADINQSYMIDSEMPEDSYYAAMDPWTGSAYQGEDGRLYMMDGMQGRSAGEQQMEEEYMNSFGYPESPMDDSFRKEYFRQEELRQSSQRLKELQDQLRSALFRAGEVQNSKNSSGETSKDSSTPESSSSDQAQKKDQPSRPTKRQTKQKSR